MNKKNIVGLVQYSPVWEDKLSNQQRIKKLIEQTGNIDLLVFPEMTLTGFTMKSADFAEELKGESYSFFLELAKIKKCAIMYGVIEKGKNKNFNTLVHLNNQGKIIKTYRKIHPFSYSKEDKNYGKGKDIVISNVQGFKIGLSICYDLRFPELYRFYGKEKVDIIIDIANWPDTRIEHWRTLLKARAIENQCFVVGVNRVGSDPYVNYNGFSSVFNPMGKELLADENKEKIFDVEIDKALVNEVRENLPFLKDIRLI